MAKLRIIAAVLMLALAGGCHQSVADADRAPSARAFPRADRPVSNVSSGFESESQRDNLHEAETVMDLAAIRPGTTVADIGAGEGYYTVRLAKRVGEKGRVLAQDIDAAALQKLGVRVEHDRLDNVSIQLGAGDDPKLPAASFDRVFLVHVYHEVNEPYAFVWHLSAALRPGGQVIVVDVDRPTDRHGIPPPQLFCEFGAVGFRLVQFVRRPELQGYFAAFEAAGKPPEPAAIKACRATRGKNGAP